MGVWEYNSGLVAFVRSLANDWAGFPGERSYASIEGQLTLVCRHDGLGTVGCRVTIRQVWPPEWSMTADLDFGVERTWKGSPMTSKSSSTAAHSCRSALMRSAVFVDTCDVVEHSDKAAWVSRLPNGPPMREDLARLVEEDHDEAETEYYEAVADPTFVTIERDQRRFRAMFRRRVRHREANRRARYQ